MSRELLKQVNSLTFLVQEEETLDKLEEDLIDIIEDLKLQALIEAGLIKECSCYIRTSQKKGIYRDPVVVASIIYLMHACLRNQTSSYVMALVLFF